MRLMPLRTITFERLVDLLVLRFCQQTARTSSSLPLLSTFSTSSCSWSECSERRRSTTTPISSTSSEMVRPSCVLVPTSPLIHAEADPTSLRWQSGPTTPTRFRSLTRALGRSRRISHDWASGPRWASPTTARTRSCGTSRTTFLMARSRCPPFLDLVALRPRPLMTDEREMAGRCLQDGYDLLTGRWSVSKPGEKERLSRILVDDRHLTLRAVRSFNWPLP